MNTQHEETPVDGKVFSIGRVWYAVGGWTIECIHDLTAGRLAEITVKYVVFNKVQVRTVVDLQRKTGIGHLEVQYSELNVQDDVATFI